MVCGIDGACPEAPFPGLNDFIMAFIVSVILFWLAGLEGEKTDTEWSRQIKFLGEYKNEV